MLKSQHKPPQLMTLNTCTCTCTLYTCTCTCTCTCARTCTCTLNTQATHKYCVHYLIYTCMYMYKWIWLYTCTVHVCIALPLPLHLELMCRETAFPSDNTYKCIYHVHVCTVLYNINIIYTYFIIAIFPGSLSLCIYSLPVHRSRVNLCKGKSLGIRLVMS